MSELLYSSAVMTLSQTTEFMRNKSVDNTIIHLVVQNDQIEFTIEQAYEVIHSDLPIRIEEIEKSFRRSLESGTLELKSGDESNFRRAVFKIPEAIIHRLEIQCDQLKVFLEESINELFSGIVTPANKDTLKDLLLDVVTNLMSQYGYVFAGQLADVENAKEFVPAEELKRICSKSIENYGVKISVEELSECIGFLFDRRDPCLNNLAFSLCSRYYITRLIGLDLPIDFLTKNIFENSTIFMDTNFIMAIVFSRSQRHNEFREILKRADELGIRFAVSEITIAEINQRVYRYKDDITKGEELIPDELLSEVQEEIAETSTIKTSDAECELDSSPSAARLRELGAKIHSIEDSKSLFSYEEMEEMKEQLSEFDKKYRHKSLRKNDDALYHDAYLYFLIRSTRLEKESNSAWFLTRDSSVIEHGKALKESDNPPYSIRLLSLLQTLSQFVESQTLKGEFADLFGELISKDLLPQEKLFSYSDLKLLIGFDIKAKTIPPELVRKATHHIKVNVLKGGGLTEQNRAEVIHEFHKFLATPEQNFNEMMKRYDKKIQDREEDIVQKELEIKNMDEKLKALMQRIETLELSKAKDQLEYATKEYEANKHEYTHNLWAENLHQLGKVRDRYIVFFILVMFVFIAALFSENIASIFNQTIIVNKWIKYPTAFMVLLIPFIRSFFDHKTVLHSFKLCKKKNRNVEIQSFLDNACSEYDQTHKVPQLNDYLGRKIE